MNIAGCLLFFCLGRTAGNADGEDKMELKRSMHARAARLLAMLAMALVCALVVAPSAYADAAVARIDETGLEYNTFDEAVAAAENNQTVTLLGNAETTGLNLSKDLTIDGEGKFALNFTDKGIALWGKALTFKNINVTMSGIGSTPYTSEWNWMSVSAGKDASLTLDDATLTMDGTGAGDVHAIYFGSNNKLNLKNGSNLTIKNYAEDALEWDGGDGGYNVNITDSTYISDSNRSGFTGTFYATIDSSTVKVLNSTGNGSNGTYFTIKNKSDVTFNTNGTWGISAWRIDMSNDSKLYANNNGYSGIWTRVLNVDKSCSVDVEGNGTKGFSAGTNGGIVFQGNRIKSAIEKGANVTIIKNAGSGIYTKQGVCNLTIGSATITNNGTGACNKDGIGADMGGGVYNVGTMKLDPSVVIYNNHAKNAGDDIYGTGVTEFGNVGNDWVLDDCNHAINGWFDDSQGARWCAHWTDNTPWHVKAVKAGTYETPVALKAAHGVTAAHAEISGTKVLKGAQLAEGDFEFTLSQNDDVISRTKNAADGSFTFGESAFDVTADDIMDADNHKVSYTLDVAEVKGNKANVTYDASVKKVVVTAVPEDDHVKLTYSVDGKDVEDLASALVFTNTYTKPAEPSEPKTPGTSTKQNLPKTGDASLAAPVAFILAAAVACGAGVVMRRRG